MQFSDLIVILGFTGGPLLLRGLADFIAWIHRQYTWPVVARKLRPRMSVEAPEGLRLSVQRAETVTGAPRGTAAAEAREDVLRVNTRVRWAHVAAWIVYATALSTHVIAFTSGFSWNTRVALGYGVLAPALLILLSEIRLPVSRRVLILLAYAAVGIALLLMFTTLRDTRIIVWEIFKIYVLFPMPGLLIFFSRRNQPFFILVIAVAVYMLASGFTLDRFQPLMTSGSGDALREKPWLILLGLAVIVGGAMVARLLLRNRRWSLLILVIIAGLIAAVLLERDIARQNLPLAVRSACFAVVGVLQILILWSIFKVLASLAKRSFLTPELIQVHISWMFLMVYFMWTTFVDAPFYSDRTAMRWGIVGALALFIATLHLLLFRIYLRRPYLAKKRLLLLRVFGRPNERESLLDDLDDNWRRIGAVDLLAASDVASRTVDSWMLEHFLLHRTDEHFLSSKEAIDERVEKRRATIQADSRYPVDAFFCHRSVWWHAFTRLAENPDVVMMDLRGFTTSNDGCVSELEYLLEHRQHNVVLIVDSHSDLPAIDKIARAAGVAENLTVLEFGKRSNEERRALFELLLKAAFPSSNG